MTQGVGMLTALVTLAGLAGAGVLLLAPRSGRPGAGLRAAVAAGSGALCGAYGLLLLTTSLASSPSVLAPGEPLRFCGFYLDCHTSAAVDSVHLVELPHEGRWRYVVRVLFASDAISATLPVPSPRAELVDDDGARLRPVSGPESLRLAGGTTVGADFVFESRRALVRPRLRVARGDLLERLTELFLAGDEDSFLHARTELLLPEPA